MEKEMVTSMNRLDILSAASQAVSIDRAATHGSAEKSFSMLAAIWSARLGTAIRADQVAIMLIDLKTVRAWGNPRHADNWVDIAGYAACGGEIAGADGAAVEPAAARGDKAAWVSGGKAVDGTMACPRCNHLPQEVPGTDQQFLACSCGRFRGDVTDWNRWVISETPLAPRVRGGVAQ